MLRIAVCDDTPKETGTILSLLQQYQAERLELDIHINSFDSSAALLEDLQNGGLYHLFLLDIAAPERDDIALAREIRTRQASVPVVYLTFSADFALEAFEVFAFSYVLKPVESVKLFAILDRIALAQQGEEERFFVLSTPMRTAKVSFSSIVCVELFGRALRLYHENGDMIVSKTIRTPFATGVTPLLEDKRFLCAHKSYVVNMSHIESLTNSSFVLKNGLEVPIPRYKYADSRAKYFAWLSQRGMAVVGGAK